MCFAVFHAPCRGGVGWQFLVNDKEVLKGALPLFYQSGRFQQDQGWYLPTRDYVCAHDRLSESGSGAQYTIIMLEEGVHSGTLFLAKLAAEGDTQRLVLCSLVIDAVENPCIIQSG